MRCGFTLRLCAAKQLPSPSSMLWVALRIWDLGSTDPKGDVLLGSSVVTDSVAQPVLSLSHLSFPSFQCKSINRKNLKLGKKATITVWEYRERSGEGEA